MSRGHRQISATGFYVAIALIAHALIGAATVDRIAGHADTLRQVGLAPVLAGQCPHHCGFGCRLPSNQVASSSAELSSCSRNAVGALPEDRRKFGPWSFSALFHRMICRQAAGSSGPVAPVPLLVPCSSAHRGIPCSWAAVRGSEGVEWIPVETPGRAATPRTARQHPQARLLSCAREWACLMPRARLSPRPLRPADPRPLPVSR